MAELSRRRFMSMLGAGAAGLSIAPILSLYTRVFAYDPLDNTLALFVEAVKDLSDPALADNGGFVVAAPDNITVGPDGRLYLCEDGSGLEKVVGVGHDGELYEAARNVLNTSEFAGACFSHDGRFMFLNIQSPGLTCVIRGQWRKGRRF